MTYAVGGTIQASDFNGFVGGNPANVSGQLNTMWGIGTGNAGLGQTAVANVSAGSTVAATNWASLINNLNAIRKNQNGAGYTNLTVPVAGANITFLSTLSSTLTAAYTNRGVLASSVSSLASSTKTLTFNVAANTATTQTALWTITFSSVDATRYFFNAGGFIRLSFGSFTNTAGNTRGTSIQTMAQTNFSYKDMLSYFYATRNGAGGTVTTDSTTGGYYGASTYGTLSSVFYLASTSYYSGDRFEMSTATNGTAGSYGAKGNIVYVQVQVTSAATNAFNTAINCSLGMTVVVYQAIGFLTSTWGTPTIA